MTADDRSSKNVNQMEDQLEKITEASEDIKEQFKFLPTPLLTAFGSSCCLIILAILLVIPVVQIGIGAAYRHQCTINSNIPLYLIVAGACGVASIVLMLIIALTIFCMFKQNSSAGTFALACVLGLIFFIIILLSLFLFAWFIVGNVWIFSVKKDVVYDDPSSSNYCHRTLYDFAFTILILSYAMSGCSCLCLCISPCLKCLTSNS